MDNSRWTQELIDIINMQRENSKKYRKKVKDGIICIHGYDKDDRDEDGILYCCSCAWEEGYRH